MVAPLTIVAHELARALMVLAVGGTPHLRFVWVAFDIPDTGPVSWSLIHTFLITLAGPVFTLVTAAGGAIICRRMDGPPTNAAFFVAWAVVLGAGLRAMLELGHALQWWQLGGVGTSRLLPDTSRIEYFLQLPPGSLLAANLVVSVLLAVVAMAGRRNAPAIGYTVIGGLMGTIVGAALWLLLIGPVLLPN